MVKGIFMSEDELDEINQKLMQIDIEIGSTINSQDNPKIVSENMARASQHIREILKQLGDVVS